MHEKRKKYYHIRKDLFWCTILLAVSFLIGYARIRFILTKIRLGSTFLPTVL